MISRVFLGFSALAIGMIGLLYLYDPNLLLARYGLEAGSAGMDNMLRSAYGGIFVGAALLFALGALKQTRQRDSMIFLAIFMSGAAIGRIASILSVGSPPETILPLLYYECATVVIALVLLMRQDNRGAIAAAN
ncbi:MAG: DUF4345 domain-containing protein [Pseudomonadota bacterium]